MQEYLFKLLSVRRISLTFQSLFKIRMAKFYCLLQSFFRHTKIRLYISPFENKYILLIKLIYICNKLSIFLRSKIPDSIDEFIIMAMSFFVFFDSHIIGFCLFIIITQIILCHKSIVHDIIPITNKERLQIKSLKESMPKLIASLSIDIDDFIIGNFAFSFRKRMKISQIKFKKIYISLTFYHNDLVDEKYFRQIFKFQKMDKTRFIRR